jgi:hypothetical protein
MLTEIQIKKENLHLQYLRRIISCLGMQTGMSRREIEETHRTVNELCRRLVRPKDNKEDAGHIYVKLYTGSSQIVIEVTDPCHESQPTQELKELNNATNLVDILERIRSLVDRIELIRNNGAITFSITKSIGKDEQTTYLGSPVNYHPALGVSSLQR